MRQDLYSFVRVSAACEEVFPYFFSLNLLQIFNGFWLIPNSESGLVHFKSAISGSESLICFEDFSTAVCKLNSYDPEVSFTASIENFTSSSFMGLKGLDCHFYFSKTGPGITEVHCKYEFRMSSEFWSLVFRLFLEGILQKKLDRLLLLASKEVRFFMDWKLTLEV